MKAFVIAQKVRAQVQVQHCESSVAESDVFSVVALVAAVLFPWLHTVAAAVVVAADVVIAVVLLIAVAAEKERIG